MGDVVICSPVRTAIGTYNGALKGVPAVDLGAAAIAAALKRSGLDPAKVQTVVMGNVIQAGNKMNPARQAAIGGGVPVSAPAMTVNRVCGSGAQAVASAAQEIMLGLIDCAVARGAWRTPHRRQRRGADHAAAALYGARRPQARRGDAVHRRRPGHRAGA